MNRLNVGIGIFVVLALEAMVYAVEVISRHGADMSWPLHARYHLLVSGIHIAGIAILFMVIAIVGLRRKSRRSWIILAVASLTTWLGWPLARLITGEPTSLETGAFIGGCLVLTLLALGLTYGPCFSDQKPEKSD